MASGPSLNREDVERVRAWRGDGRLVYVVNNTYEMAPWADLLFVGDGNWLERYAPQCDFAGERVTASKVGQYIGWTVTPAGFQWHQNSGAGAIAWAIHNGAKRVFLLGYDCQKTGGKSHWHPPHEGVLRNGRQLKDAPNIADWPASFAGVADLARAKGVVVVNCSRVTALKCFQRARIEDLLGSKNGD